MRGLGVGDEKRLMCKIKRPLRGERPGERMSNKMGRCNRPYSPREIRVALAPPIAFEGCREFSMSISGHPPPAFAADLAQLGRDDEVRPQSGRVIRRIT